MATHGSQLRQLAPRENNASGQLSDDGVAGLLVEAKPDRVAGRLVNEGHLEHLRVAVLAVRHLAGADRYVTKFRDSDVLSLLRRLGYDFARLPFRMQS